MSRDDVEEAGRLLQRRDALTEFLEVMGAGTCSIRGGAGEPVHVRNEDVRASIATLLKPIDERLVGLGVTL